jgi:hypothetical protein
MSITSYRARSVLALALAACSTEQAREPNLATVSSDLDGIVGANCAGASPAMTAPDGNAYPLQSVIRYYYLKLQGAWTKIADENVLDLWLPAEVEQVGEAFYEWQAKSAQIFRERDALGYAHRYYRGMFGYLDEVDVAEGTCSGNAIDASAQDRGTLAHVALSQAGACGQNDDGTTKFWQVNGIVLLQIGRVLDAYDLVAAGVAAAVTTAPADRCILPAEGGGGAPGPGPGPSPVPTPVPTTDGNPDIPCRVAFRSDAVTEGVVLPVPSSAAVAGVPLGKRPFTAAGRAAMPNGLDQVRTILRSNQLTAMAAARFPTLVPAPWAGPTHVQVVEHRIGPVQSPSPVLLADERAWVDGVAGTYASACCHQECTTTAAAAEAQRETTDDASAPPIGGGGGGPTCQTVCVAEAQCLTGKVTDGLITMVSSGTSKECFGSCPEPASGAPATGPTCEP